MCHSLPILSLNYAMTFSPLHPTHPHVSLLCCCSASASLTPVPSSQIMRVFMCAGGVGVCKSRISSEVLSKNLSLNFAFPCYPHPILILLYPQSNFSCIQYIVFQFSQILVSFERRKHFWAGAAMSNSSSFSQSDTNQQMISKYLMEQPSLNQGSTNRYGVWGLGYRNRRTYRLLTQGTGQKGGEDSMTPCLAWAVGQMEG